MFVKTVLIFLKVPGMLVILKYYFVFLFLPLFWTPPPTSDFVVVKYTEFYHVNPF